MSGYTLGGVVNLKLFGAILEMTKRYIFGWMEQTLLLRRSDQGSGKGNEAEMIGCQWLVAQCCSVLHQCHCVSVGVLEC